MAEAQKGGEADIVRFGSNEPRDSSLEEKLLSKSQGKGKKFNSKSRGSHIRKRKANDSGLKNQSKLSFVGPQTDSIHAVGKVDEEDTNPQHSFATDRKS